MEGKATEWPWVQFTQEKRKEKKRKSRSLLQIKKPKLLGTTILKKCYECCVTNADNMVCIYINLKK